MALSTGNAVASTQFTDAMKTLYLGPLNDQVERATVILDRLEKNSEDVSGNFAYVALISARNPGVGSRKDTDGSGPSLPAVGSQSYDNATFRMAYHYGRGGVTGPAMRASSSNAGSFAKALDVEMRGLQASLPESLNRQLWSYGHGRCGTLNVNQASSTLMTFDAKSIFSMKVGDRVHGADISADATGITPAAGTTVTAIDFDSSANVHSVTLAAASGTSLTLDEDAFYFGAQASLGAADVSRAQEMYGIPAAIDDGAIGADEGLGGATTPAEAGEFIDGNVNYGRITRSTNAFWQSKVLQNPDGAGTNRTLKISTMEQAYLNAIHVGGADPSNLDIYTNPGIWATFGLLHIGDRVFNDFKETFKGGWIALMFNNRPVFADRDCPRDMMWFLDMSTLMLLTQSGYEFMDRDGSILRNIVNRDAWEFTLFRDVQLGCRNASKNVLLDDITAVYNVEAAI